MTILVHFEGSTWWAEAPDVRGFSAAAPSLRLLMARCYAGLGRDDLIFQLVNDGPLILNENPGEAVVVWHP